jgi:tetratricopeptide (TPR) repeat protein
MRWGERDRAKALLRGSIETLEGPNKAVAQGNLATLLKDEGKLDEALATYQEVYRTFEALGAKQQMAAVLAQSAIIYRQKGQYDKATEYELKQLQIARDEGLTEQEGISLYNLSILYHIKGDYATALARSQEAEKLARKVKNEALTATTLHQQGLILNGLAHAAQADEDRMTHRRAAMERFRQALDISQRIGDEAGAADTLGELGKLWMFAGQMREAIAAFNEALDIFTRLGNPAKAGITLEILGLVHERQGQYAAALEKLQQALALYQQYAPPEVERCKQNIAQVQARLRDG